jgi:hypothetical protein
MSNRDPTQLISMPVRAKPYGHQVEAFNFVCGLYELAREGGATSISISSRGSALLMDM